jgi:hypothetical protein
MGLQDSFPQYFPRQDVDVASDFFNATFVFDTNVYLHLYRLGAVARAEVLTALQEALQGRIWVPHHVALEVAKNRSSLLVEAADTLTQHIASITAARGNAAQSLRDGALEQILNAEILEDARTQIDTAFLSIVGALEAQAKTLPSPKDKDVALSYLDEILKNQDLNAPTLEWYSAASKEAAERYSKKLPPGYKDDRKDEVILGAGAIPIQQKYGDYFIWKQILDKVKSRPDDFKTLIFVTGDRKEDWWDQPRGKTQGPRPELRLEMHEAGVKSFHMYHLNRLLELLRSRVQAPKKAVSISDRTLAEVEVAESISPNHLGSPSTPLNLLPTSPSNPYLGALNFSPAPISGSLVEYAFLNWLTTTYPSQRWRRGTPFPSFVIQNPAPDTESHGLEILFVSALDQIRLSVLDKLPLAESWLDTNWGLLSGNHSQNRTFTFAIVFANSSLSSFHHFAYQHTVREVQSLLAYQSRIHFLLGYIEGTQFIQLEIPSMLK